MLGSSHPNGTNPARADGWSPGLANNLFAFWRTTAFRLTIGFAAIFAAFSAVLLVYLFSQTSGALIREADRAIDREYDGLVEIHGREGAIGVNLELFRRAAGADSGFFYMLVGARGERISGDFSELPRAAPSEGKVSFNFFYELRNAAGLFERRAARAIIGRQADGAVILVARDVQEARELARTLSRSVWTGASFGLILALIGGVLVSRATTTKVRAMARTAEDVMAGDLSKRVPDLAGDDEFSTLSRSLNLMLSRLERLVHATRYAGDAIAHDLRTPLGRLRNRLELLREQLDGLPERTNELKEVQSALLESDQLLDTFNAILRLARLQAGQAGAFQMTDIARLVTEIGELYEPACEEAGLAMSVEVPRELQARADASLVSQAVANLLDNAIKYTPGGGALALRARKTRSGATEIAVTDTGPGIPESERAHVVERFVRLESARTHGGSGLGLTLVAAIAEIHGGQLELSDGARGPDGPGLKAALILPK